MRGRRHACSGAMALASTAVACAGGALAQGPGVCPPGEIELPLQSPLMRAVDRAADKSASPDRARLQILARLQLSTACYPGNLTPEQLDELVARTQLLPPTAAPGGPFGPRYFADITCWLGAGGQGDAGTSRPAQLTFSFPSDGTHWGLTCAGFLQGDNDLGAKLTAAYGSLDRGREFIRSSLAAWRTVAALTYSEVPDDNSAQDTSIPRVASRGDIRIGGLGFGPIGSSPLAYNALPSSNSAACAGGDMTINTNYFTPVYFTATAGNFLYFRNTVAHEHGHGLGFLHSVPCNQTKLMEPTLSTGTILLSPDEVRAAIRNYGDRFAPANHSAAGAKDFGNLTSPTVRSVIERDLGVNGPAVVLNTVPPTVLSEDDWFKFTLGSSQNVTILVDPTGYGPAGACCVSTVCTMTTQAKCTATFVLRGSCSPSPCSAATFPTTCTGSNADPDWCQGQQTGGCSGSLSVVDATQAGDLALELRAANGTTVLATSNSSTLGITELISQANLAAGTYYVRVWDSSGGLATAQVTQTYDLTIRVGTSFAPPRAIAGVQTKRAAADAPTYFIGNHNSYATEPAASLPTGNYAWDFDGDGVYDSAGAGQTQPIFTYRSNGTFNVTLKVTDSNGLSATDTVQCVVYGATTSITSTSPSIGAAGATVPVSIIGANLKGVTSASQVSVSGGGITVSGTPTPNLLGTRITGLSFVIAPGAAATDRDITITNSDGQGSSGTGTAVFTVQTTATTGACCAPDGSCTVVVPASCAGTAQGLGTVCQPNPCPQPNVACCAATGACSFVTSAACATSGGAAQAFGSVCQPNPCPQPSTGACCAGSTCSATTAAACVGTNQRFAGVGSTCNAGGNFITPCCLANFNQNATLEVQDIFDYLNAWFAQNPATDLNGGGVSVQDIFDFLNAWFAGC